MIVFTAIICFARHAIFSWQVYLFHDRYTFPRLVYCFMTGIVFHNMHTFSRRVYLFYNRYNCFHNMYMFSRRVYFFTTGIFSTSSILFHDRYISSRREWNVIPPQLKTGSWIGFQTETGITRLWWENHRRKKRVSYSLGEAHLSGGVRACGKVVLKGKQALWSKFFGPTSILEHRRKQKGKNVSYSLGEAHLSGGVRACGTVV